VRRVEVNASARADIEKAGSWYERQQEGLGDRFLNAVLDTMDRIALNPEGYEKVIREARQATVEKFPYCVFFTIKDDVLVIGCLHGKRDRRLAVERASGITPIS
jgi:plasmid stabilization system protein ParE